MIRILASFAVATVVATSAAFASGSLKSTIVSYDAANKSIITGSFENISIRFEGLEVPETLSAGDVIELTFEAGEDGFDRITSITILEDN